jgi:hypothetical protein
MQRKLLFPIAAAAFALVGCASALAAPLRCSTEGQACIAACGRLLNRADAPNCITNCRTSQSVCTHSGCWISGTDRLCGLLRQ